MAAGETEEKNLPPSQRKLKKAREKGQVASSQDFVAALTLAAGVVVLYSSWPAYMQVFTGSMRLALDGLPRPLSQSGLPAVFNLASLIATTIAPLLIIVAATGFLGHVMHKKGLIFSADPIKPDFNRINPGEGLKKIFSYRNFVDFGVVLARSFLWFGIAATIIWFALPGLVAAPICALPCVAETGIDLNRTLLLIALLLIIVAGLLDLPLQTFMFLRDQKMSRTELKHEMKEQEGSPEFIGHRREQHRQFASGTGQTGIRAASLVIISSDAAVAIRYDAESQPLPIVVARGRGVHADPILAAARQMGTPIEIEPTLAAALADVGIGAMVPERLFTPVAMALVKHNLAG